MKKLKYILAALPLCFCIGARASNVVTISSTEGAPGDEVTVSIGLQNTDELSSLQVSIPLYENLTLVSGSEELGSRCASHSLTVGVKDGILNVFIYSISMATISGTNGEVASFKLKLGNQPQTIALEASKLVLTNSSGDAIEGITQGGEVTTRCAKAQYSTMEVDFGEVPIRSTYQQMVTVTNVGNADLIITDMVFSDVMTFSSTTALPIVVGAGDSRELNITYAPVNRGSISKTLKVECNSISKLNTIKLLAQPFAVNELHIQDASGISDEEVKISMTMNNMDAISGYQVEFNLPEQFEYVENSFALSDRKQDHVATASINDKKLRILVYSPTDKALTDNDGEIGSFKVKLVGRYGTTLTPTKTVLSATVDNKVENVVSAVYGGQVSIKSPTISCDGVLNFGAVSVTEACEKKFTISNYGSAPLTVSRIVFDNEALSIKESLPIVIQPGANSMVTIVYSSVEQTSFDGAMHIYSNDPDLRMREVAVSGSRFAPNYMGVEICDISQSEKLAIDIALNNYDAVKGLQFDIVYPGQYYTAFDNNYTVESRAEGMSVTMRQIDSNTLRCFCYFLTGGGIATGEGKIMSLLLNPVNDGVPLGGYTVYVRNIRFGTDEMQDKYAGTETQSSFTVKDGTPVTITANSYTIKYGDELPAFGYTSEGATLEGTPSITCEATGTSPAGEYAIFAGKGTVTNYNVTYVDGRLTISKAPLKITARDYTIKQGEPLPAFEADYDGFKNEETSEVLTKSPAIATVATSASEPGEYDITVSGAESQNYEISYVSGKLTIIDADPVTVKANSYTIKYGDELPTFGYTSEGATLEGTPSITCEATGTSPAGEYAIFVGKGTVTNYNVTYVDGRLTISKAPLKITARDYTIKQGEPLPAFEADYDGFKNEETSEVLTKSPAIATVATSASEPGEYDITVSGAESQNYEISYVSGKLTILPYLRGDVNGDEVVNGTDIQTIINFIVAGEYDKKADVNEDGKVNGTDIQEVINIIVNAE